MTDDPRNADGIGKKELLAISFGTSFNDSRARDIKGIEDALEKAFPEWSVRRAFLIAFLWFRKRYLLTDERIAQIAAQIRERKEGKA